jgi:phage FluMu protein Com
MKTDHLQLKMQRQKHVDEFTIKLDASALYINKFMDKWNNTTFDLDVKCDLIRSYNSMYDNKELHAHEMCAKKSKRNQ